MPFRGSTARTAAAEAPIRPSLPRAAALPRAGSTRANAARPSLRGPRRAGRGARGLTRSPRRSQPPPPSRPPSVSASPERAGSPRPRALPRAGLTAHVGPGRAALAAAPGTARHGTARRGGRGGRRGGGLRCALPAPPRWKEAVPRGTLGSRTAIASFLRPPVLAAGTSRAFSRGFYVNRRN